MANFKSHSSRESCCISIIVLLAHVSLKGKSLNTSNWYFALNANTIQDNYTREALAQEQ